MERVKIVLLKFTRSSIMQSLTLNLQRVYNNIGKYSGSNQKCGEKAMHKILFIMSPIL